MTLFGTITGLPNADNTSNEEEKEETVTKSQMTTALYRRIRCKIFK